jgi:xylose dehydrogenase (NAD/NADP)
MSEDPSSSGKRIGVGVVSPDPVTDGGLAAGMPEHLFELAAVSDEGMPEPAEYDGPEPFYCDFNMLLEDDRVELVIVEGPVEKRRDFAVRALNAGRHVVVAQPFAETAIDASRVMKTALKAGLVATSNMVWRDDPDLTSLMAALAAENIATVQGALVFRTAAAPTDGSPPGSLLAEAGIEILDQVHMLLRDEVKMVSAHLQVPVAGGPDDGFLIYLPLRLGGWAVAHAARRTVPALPAWLVYTPGMTFTASGGRTVGATPAGGERAYELPAARVDFWENLFGAVRRGEALKCHPADIVKAMKLQEAALESARTGDPVSV